MTVNLTLVRYIVAGAVLLVLAVIAAVIVVLATHGLPVTGPQIDNLLGVVGTLAALLASLLTTGAVAGAAQKIQSDVNGHLQQHLGHTDAQVRQIAQDEVAKAVSQGGSGAAGGGSL